MKTEPAIERRDKILAGLKIAYAQMLEFKRYKNSEVVVARNGEIMRLKP
ncbi:sulfur carrier protein ThiS [Hymenobacter sp. 9A]|uniref:Sulfur carrier protein ThiS n=1 Tax=Hymenobacter caeli TaxID=2735894 RepID=A0ABX2FSV2_9BACT|nr:sulfur carrier protein ThiS [Hymenobacter caeli]